MKKSIFIMAVVFMFVSSMNIQAEEWEPEEEAVESDVEKLPPEPVEPPVIREEVKELTVLEGKEVVLDVYTVKKGDWLSKIAKREYNNNSQWKVIYMYNNYIKDPHWIFPGDKIILPKIVDKLPEIPEVTKKETEEKVEEKREYGDFLAPPDFEFTATITGFKTKRLLYAQGEYLFIDLGRENGITENQRFYIYREGRRIAHPYTGERLGSIVENIGEIRVTKDIEDYVSTARIVYADRSIKKGDMLLMAK